MNHERGGGVVPYEAHNLEAPVQFGPPQQSCSKNFLFLLSLFEVKWRTLAIKIS